MTAKQLAYLPFMKMHGLGNDFVVIDARRAAFDLDQSMIMRLADRHRGVGFDQLTMMSDAKDADIKLAFWNSDGTPSAACGNATRCVAKYLMDEQQQNTLTLKTDRGVLLAEDGGRAGTSVNMGQPQLSWNQIPLAREVDTLKLPISGDPTATGMGNPHCTFFVDDAEAIDLAEQGGAMEHHPLFPERCNVQFASLAGENKLRVRVWERGVGITLASGSSSCATAVAATRRGLTGHSVAVELDGGTLNIDWRNDGVWMTGPTAHVFDGKWWL